MITHDARMEALTRRNANLMVPWYLMAAHAYYELDSPILSDRAFDGLAKRLLAAWPRVEHRHKHLITEGDLRAGTLLRRDLPALVKDSATALLNELTVLRARNPIIVWLLCS